MSPPPEFNSEPRNSRHASRSSRRSNREGYDSDSAEEIRLDNFPSRGGRGGGQGGNIPRGARFGNNNSPEPSHDEPKPSGPARIPVIGPILQRLTGRGGAGGGDGGGSGPVSGGDANAIAPRRNVKKYILWGFIAVILLMAIIVAVVMGMKAQPNSSESGGGGSGPSTIDCHNLGYPNGFPGWPRYRQPRV